MYIYFFMDEKNYRMSQINTIAIPQGNIDINVTSA